MREVSPGHEDLSVRVDQFALFIPKAIDVIGMDRGRELVTVEWNETGAEMRGLDEVLSVGLTTPAVGVPVLWWRAVDSTHTAFTVETFIDKLTGGGKQWST